MPSNHVEEDNDKESHHTYMLPLASDAAPRSAVHGMRVCRADGMEVVRGVVAKRPPGGGAAVCACLRCVDAACHAAQLARERGMLKSALRRAAAPARKCGREGRA